jgi:hypothetical protein
VIEPLSTAEATADAGEDAFDPSSVAIACSRLASSERDLLERVLARGGRVPLAEVSVDPAAIARLERLLGWFGFEPGSPRSGPLARVALAASVRDLVASSLAGIPALRRRPVLRTSGTGDASLESIQRRATGAERLVAFLVERGGIVPLAALPRELRTLALGPPPLPSSSSGGGSSGDPLTAALLGGIGRLDLRSRGIDLDAPVAFLAREIYATLARSGAAPLAPAPRALAGTLLAVEPALALARENELAETREGLLGVRARERLASAFPRARLRLGPPEDELAHLVRALVAAGLLARGAGGTLSPGPAVPGFRAASVRERARILLRGYELGSPAPGRAALPAHPLAEAVREEVLALESTVPIGLPARLGLHRWLDGPEVAATGDPIPLEDAVALAHALVLPAAEAMGLITVEGGMVGPTALLESLRDDDQPGEERPVVASADGEAVLLPGRRSARAALLLGRLGELVASGEVLRFRVTAASARAAQASGDDLDASLASLRELVRGELPASFERLLRDAAAGSVRARARVLHVIEIPRVGAADRAARVLGALVLDRLTPTLLALSGPLTQAARRALAKEGVFVEDSEPERPPGCA